MSFEALARVRDVQAPSSSALLLLYILAEYAGPDGCCWPSQKTLCERSQLGERAVGLNLAKLRKAGLIIQKQRRRKDGSRTSDHFQLAYYSPEQGAENAACEISRKPRKGKQISPPNNPQNVRVDKPHISPSQTAHSAGLTTFEPVTEHITFSPREIGAHGVRSLAGLDGVDPQHGLARELTAVPAELIHQIAEECIGQPEALRTYLPNCLWDAEARTLHPYSGLARGAIDRDLRSQLRRLELTLGDPVGGQRSLAARGGG